MKLLKSPLIVMILGVTLGAGTGLFTFWQAGVALVAEAREKMPSDKVMKRPDKPWDFWVVELEELTEELQGRLKDLDGREEELTRHEARIEAEERELAQTRAELQGIRNQIDATLTEVQAAELKNLKGLANTYSTLSPEAALAILTEMDDTTVTKILALMKPESTGAIFEAMAAAPTRGNVDQVKRAAVLSDRLRLLRPPGAGTGR